MKKGENASILRKTGVIGATMVIIVGLLAMVYLMAGSVNVARGASSKAASSASASVSGSISSTATSGSAASASASGSASASASGSASASASGSAASTSSASTSSVMESADYATLFPLEYNSSLATHVDDGTHTEPDDLETVRGHAAIRDILEAPIASRSVTNSIVQRDENGYYEITGYTYDPETNRYYIDPLTDDLLDENVLTGGCVSCKSSKFNDLYDEYGAAAFSMLLTPDVLEQVDGQYWDCASCHDGTPSADNVTSNLMFFNALADGLIQDLDAGEKACGQCHNSYDYRKYIDSEDDLERFRPYRYGYDIDSLYKANLEDNTNCTTDEETGIVTFYATHSDVEMYQTSPMNALGVSCTDCHMPKTTDEVTGTTYTSHDASGYVLDNEDALNYCLTCHTSDTIKTTDDMAAWVRSCQQEVADKQAGVEAKEATLLTELTDAIKNGTKDEDTLAQAKDLYSRVTWYICFQQGPEPAPGIKVAMSDADGILDKADEMCDEALALLK